MEVIAAADHAGEVDPPAVAPEALLATHLDRVLRFATMVSPAGTDPQDVAQDAMVTALRRLPAYDPARGPLDAWLWRIVVTRARDAGRAARRRSMLMERLRAPGAPGPSPEGLALERVRDADLVAAVRRLPATHRTVVALRYGADLTHAEIARLLGTTRMAVVKTLSRALVRLRDDLEVPR